MTLIVKITRDDGSVTYKGPYRSEIQAEREAGAWREGFPSYDVQIIEHTKEVSAEVNRWMETTRDGSRYFPPPAYVPAGELEVGDVLLHPFDGTSYTIEAIEADDLGLLHVTHDRSTLIVNPQWSMRIRPRRKVAR